MVGKIGVGSRMCITDLRDLVCFEFAKLDVLFVSFVTGFGDLVFVGWIGAA